MSSAHIARALVASLAFGLAACRAPAPPAVPEDVTPAVALSAERVAAGGPVAITYRWTTGPAFRGLGGGYHAFVHVLSEDGARVIVDDHVPEPAPGLWQPGQEYRYTRLVFPPRMFPGRLEVRVGLYSRATGQRVALRGDDRGRREYRAGTFTSVKAPDVWRFPRRLSGWLPPGGDPAQPFEIRHGTQADSTAVWPNPGADTLIVLATCPSTDQEGERLLELEVNDGRVSVPIRPARDEIVKVHVPSALLGAGEDLYLVLRLQAPASGGASYGPCVRHLVAAPVALVEPEVRAGASTLQPLPASKPAERQPAAVPPPAAR